MDIVYVKMYKINVLEYIFGVVFFIFFEKVLYLFNYDFIYERFYLYIFI